MNVQEENTPKRKRGRPEKVRTPLEKDRLAISHQIWSKGKLLVPVNLGGEVHMIEAVKSSIQEKLGSLPSKALHDMKFQVASRGSAKGKMILTNVADQN